MSISETSQSSTIAGRLGLAELAAEHHLHRLRRDLPRLRGRRSTTRGSSNPNNLLNIVRQTAMIAVMAIAMTFVLSAGEIDLSVGAVAGLASVTTAMAIAVGGLPLGIARRPRDRPRGWRVQRRPDHADRHPVVPDDARHDGHRQGRRDVDQRHRGRPDHQPDLCLALRRRQHRPDPGAAVLDADPRRRRPCRAASARASAGGCSRPAAARPRRASPASILGRSSSAS